MLSATVYPVPLQREKSSQALPISAIPPDQAMKSKPIPTIYRVEAVQFTGPVKEALAYPVKAAFEDLNLRIPFDRNLQADLRAIKKETTAAGNIRFSADRSENGHADRFWALALALHAASTSEGLCRFEASEKEKNSNWSDKPEKRNEIQENNWPC